MSERQEPKHAAAVILLKRAEPNGFEVLLTRRSADMAGLGWVYCFPGGVLAKADCSATMLRRCHGLAAAAARKIVGAHLTPQQALGLWAAGIRQLFEEVGILFAASEAGKRLVRIAADKSNLGDKALSFQSLLENEGLLWDASSLGYFSHWQTPAEISLRLDTRFFLAVLPQGQTFVPTSLEVAHSQWLTPDRALELFGKNQLPIVFPTFASLRTLADFESLESLAKEYGLNAPKD